MPRLRKKTAILLGLLVVFVLAIAFALWREVEREAAELRNSVSGRVEVDSRLYARGVADIVRTDRLALLLVDPESREPVAVRFISPLVPPQTIRVGQADAGAGAPLEGPYLVVGITDKDGEMFRRTPGEVYGRTDEPVALGTEELTLTLDEPFRGGLFNGAGDGAAEGRMAGRAGEGSADPGFSVQGTITVSPQYEDRVAESDRLVVLLFDPSQGRPVAFRIYSHARLPREFSVTLPPQARAAAEDAYELRVVTDKDDNPFGAAEGELVGRSEEPVPLGTTDLRFELDQPYRR